MGREKAAAFPWACLLLCLFVASCHGQGCRSGSDVIVVLDASSSISRSQFNRFVTFSSKLVRQLDIDSGRSRAGLLYFSDSGSVHFNLSTYANENLVADAISSAKYTRGKTKIARALEIVRTQMFTPSAGDRPDNPNVIVLLTDGEFFDHTETLAELQRLSQAGITVLPVANGKWVSAVGLEALASIPKSRSLFRTRDPQEFMTTLLNDVRSTLCNEVNDCSNNPCAAGSTCVDGVIGFRCLCPFGRSGVRCDFDCRNKLDIVFAVDMSGSIGLPDSRLTQNFVREAIMGTDVVGGSRVGMVTFSTTAQIVYHMGEHTNSYDAAMGLNVMYKSGSTNMAGALRLVRESMFIPPYDRPDALNVLVLVTDGKSDNRTATLLEAAATKSAGIHILVVSVGRDASRELQAVASFPQKDNVFVLAPTRGVPSLSTQLLRSLCNVEDNCLINPCSHGARCVDKVNSFQCICNSGYNGKFCERRCKNQADVVIIVDASTSIMMEDFERLREFLRIVLDQWVIGIRDTQVALVYYSDQAHVYFQLGTYATKEDILQAILFLPHVGGPSNPAAAFKLVREQIFTGENGDRDTVINYGILITDRPPSMNKYDAVPEAVKAKIQGIFFYVLTVNSIKFNSVDTLRLEGLASEPLKTTMFRAQNYSHLLKSEDLMIKTVGTICNEVDDCASQPCRNNGRCTDGINRYFCICTDRYTGPNCGRDCTRQLDVAFLLDVSYSTDAVVTAMRNVIKTVMQGLNFSFKRTRVSFASFNQTTTVHFGFNEYSGLEEALQAVYQDQLGDGTNIALALQQVNTRIFSPALGDRVGIPNVLVILTDGKATSGTTDIRREAQLLRERDVSIYVVASGTHINMPNINTLVGDTGSSFVTKVHRLLDETDVEQTSDELLNQLCL